MRHPGRQERLEVRQRFHCHALHLAERRKEQSVATHRVHGVDDRRRSAFNGLRHVDADEVLGGALPLADG
jgi:hypothetical protein